MCSIAVAHTIHDAIKFAASQQHRGREAAGIAAVADGRIDVIKWLGEVSEFSVTSMEKIFSTRHGYHTFLAHTRYATRGDKSLEAILRDAQPQTLGGQVDFRGDHVIIFDADMAAIHNGQMNEPYIAAHPGQSDTLRGLEYFRDHGEKAIMRNIPLAYTLAIADKHRKEVIVMRDRTGIRPGVIGDKGGKTVIASETKAFYENGVRSFRDMRPGTIYYISPEGECRAERIVKPTPIHCMFCWEYLAHPTSTMSGQTVMEVRKDFAAVLAQRLDQANLLDGVDYITYNPESPKYIALELAELTDIPLLEVFYKKKRQRSFQGSTMQDRRDSIQGNMHLVPYVENLIHDKTLLDVEDSIVRGNVAKWTHHLLYEEAKVRQATLVVATPPVGILGEDGSPCGCRYGVDMSPESADYIARITEGNGTMRNATHEEIEAQAGMPVFYMQMDDLIEVFERRGIPPANLCRNCIGGPDPLAMLTYNGAPVGKPASES